MDNWAWIANILNHAYNIASQVHSDDNPTIFSIDLDHSWTHLRDYGCFDCVGFVDAEKGEAAGERVERAFLLQSRGPFDLRAKAVWDWLYLEFRQSLVLGCAPLDRGGGDGAA